MRILFLSNFFPPHSRGGYEQWCQEVAVELANRGHQVTVLTSRAADMPDVMLEAGISVHRKLFLEVEGGLGRTMVRLLRDRRRVEATNLDYVRQIISTVQPDVAMIWGMWNVPATVPALVEELLPGRVAYYLCDYWLSLPNAYVQRWQEDAKHGYGQWAKRALGKVFLAHLQNETRPVLQLENPICVSQAVRDILVEAGVPIDHARVIYGGTQTADFVAASMADQNGAIPDGRLKLVYIGRIVPEKGVQTMIEGVRRAVTTAGPQLQLDIYGHGDPDFEISLQTMVRQHGLDEVVIFKGRVPRSDIPAVLGRYDALIFSSEWQEPFARTVLEAMAAGLVVIGTTTGGTGEILKNEETGLTYRAGDAADLADRITQLAANPKLLQRLARIGQELVIRNYDFARMVNELEAALVQMQEKSLTLHGVRS